MRRNQRQQVRDENIGILMQEYTLVFEDRQNAQPEFKIKIELMLNRFGSVWFTYNIMEIGSPFAQTGIFPGGIPPNYTLQVPLKEMFGSSGSNYITTGVSNRSSINSRHSIELLNVDNILYFRVHYVDKERKTFISKWMHLLPGHEFRIWSTQDITENKYSPGMYDGELPQELPQE